MKEQWKPVPDFPDYEVSNTGLVRSLKRVKPHILKSATRTSGYQTVLLRRNGKTHCFRIGCLVLLAFRGPCPEGCEMCHNDGNGANDHLDNLRWDTHLSNMQDAARHGKVGRPKLLSTIAKEKKQARKAKEEEILARKAMDMQEKMTDSLSIGKRIKILRAVHGISQRELVQRVKMCGRTLSDVENDHTLPKPKHMVAIMTELGWSEQVETAFAILAGDGDKA